MLNTKSCAGAAMVWLAIAAIAGTVLWGVMEWDYPPALLSQFLESDAGEALKQFQTLVAGVIGFCLASFAYWYNGHQDRQIRARDGDARTRTLAHALMLEVERLEGECDMAAARFAGLAEDAEKRRPGDPQPLVASNRMLLKRSRAGGLMLADLSIDQLSRLGSNVCSAVLMLRNAVAELDRETADLGRDGANPSSAELRDIARAFSAVCLRCARVRPLLWTLARHGAGAADERDPAAGLTSDEVDGHVSALAARGEASSAGNVINAPAKVAVIH